MITSPPRERRTVSKGGYCPESEGRREIAAAGVEIKAPLSNAASGPNGP
jgi:hypothetical protein